MTDKYERDRQYQYTANASMVVHKERTGNNKNLPSGESESLVGRRMQPFGDLVSKEENPELKKLKEKAEKKAKKNKKKKPKSESLVHEVNRNVIGADIHEEVVYRPRQKETRIIYDQILNIVQKHMGDYPLDTLKAVADEVLAILKTDNMKDVDRKKEIEGIIDKLDDNTFNLLTVYATKITDYEPENQENMVNREEELKVDVELDKEGEDSEDSDEDVYAYDDGQEDQKQGHGSSNQNEDNKIADEGTVLKVGQQDAFWIQNQLQGFIKNQSRSKEFFTVLGLDKPEE